MQKVIGQPQELLQRIEELEAENKRLKTQLPGVLSEVPIHLIENLVNPLFVKNNRREWIYVNQQFSQLMGKSAEELVGKTDHDFLPKDEANRFWKIDNIVLESGEDHVSVDELYLNDGKRYTLLTLKRRIESDEGEYYILATLTDFSEIKKKEEELVVKNNQIVKQSEEIKLLLKEIHHRVKNNLQIIISVLNLRSNLTKNDKLFMAFQEVKNKVISMARIHEMLYQSQNLSEIDVKEYIRTLTADLIETYSVSTPIELKQDIKATEFGINTLIPLGLILTELISNAIKHAFISVEQGKIEISLTQKAGMYQLTIKDNGVGFSRKGERADTLGFDLVDALVEQLNGMISFENDKGTLITIEFESID